MVEHQRPDGWLSVADAEAAERMVEQVSAVFAKSQPETYKYTPHDVDHFARVERLITELIPPPQWKKLKRVERKLLSWAAWTHDIGMNRNLHTPGVTDDEIRQKHVERSAAWVVEEQATLGLSATESQVLAQFIQYHSRKNELSECPARRQCDGVVVRPRLLAAYLRLADALDVTHQRVESHERDRFPYLLQLVAEDADETIFHWVKSFVVSGIRIVHKRQTLEVEFQFPSPREDGDYDLLARYVLEELRSELQTVEQTLNEGGLSSFRVVVRVGDVHFHALPHHDWAARLRRVLNYLRIVYSPNSTEMAMAALEAIRDVAEGRHSALKVSLEQLLESLLLQRDKRKCHNALNRIIKFVRETLHSAREDRRQGNEASIAMRLKIFADCFTGLIRPDGARVKLQSENFWQHVQQLRRGGPRGSADRFDFLLCGCSESVVAAFRHKPRGARLGLWIAEGRPKSKHGPYNTQTYVDAERYTQMLHEAQTTYNEPLAKDIEINIIPDASVATLMSRAKVGCFADRVDDQTLPFLPLLDAVVFGANGVYHKDACVAHTAGHLGIALLATKEFKIPVVVVASAMKVQERASDGWMDSLRDQEWNWLSSDPDLLGRFVGRDNQHRVRAWNLREDHLHRDVLSTIVSEFGVLNLAGRAREVSKELREWEQKIDGEIGRFVDLDKKVLRIEPSPVWDSNADRDSYFQKLKGRIRQLIVETFEQQLHVKLDSESVEVQVTPGSIEIAIVVVALWKFLKDYEKLRDGSILFLQDIEGCWKKVEESIRRVIQRDTSRVPRKKK